MSEVVAAFDYGVLDEGAREAARAAAERIRVRMKRTVQDIIEIGRDLAEVKKKIGHGNFLGWIAAEFEMGNTSAQRFMLVAERYGKNTNLVNLKPSALYELAAPNTPDEVRDRVEARVKAGETVTLEDIKAIKDQWTAERRDLKRQIDEAKDKAKDARATQSDFGQQLDSLKEALAALRDERDTLQYELQNQASAAPSQDVADLRRQLSALREERDALRSEMQRPQPTTRSEPQSGAELETVDTQIATLRADWNRVSLQARAEFLRGLGYEPIKGAA